MKRLILLFLISALLALTSCQRKTTSEEALLGTWYTQDGCEYRVISFEKRDDNSTRRYTTENFLSNGTWQIAKDGSIKLIDQYKTIFTLYLTENKNNGEELLLSFAEGEFFTVSFSKKYREKPNAVVFEEEKLHGEKEQLLIQAAQHILSSAPWPLQDNPAQNIVFDGKTITFYGNKEEFSFGSIDVRADHYLITLVSKTGEYMCKLYPLSSSGDTTKPDSYRLEISYNGGKETISIRSGFVSMSSSLTP